MRSEEFAEDAVKPGPFTEEASEAYMNEPSPEESDSIRFPIDTPYGGVQGRLSRLSNGRVRLALQSDDDDFVWARVDLTRAAALELTRRIMAAF